MVKRICLYPVLSVFVLLFFCASTTLVEAAKAKKGRVHVSSKKSKKRKGHHTACNTVVGKKQALEFLRSGSPELQMLAGVSEGTEAEINPQDIDLSVQKQLLQEVEDISDLQNEDDGSIDAESFKMLWLSYIDPVGDEESQRKLSCGISKQQLMNSIMDWLGTRYHFGGSSRSGIDCSAFVRSVFAASANIVLPRTAQSQIEVGQRVRNVEDLQFGDLVFFHTRRHAYVSHVGIYLGNKLFAHSSTRFGVTVSSLESDYYSAHLIGARRLSESDVAQLTANDALAATGTR